MNAPEIQTVSNEAAAQWRAEREAANVRNKQAGIFTPDNVPATTRALLDGVDVSDQCSAACPAKGWVDLLVTDQNGHIIADEQGDAMTKRVYGRVVVEFPE